MNRPFKCTGCGEKFQSWQNWHEHRAVIRSWEIHRHEEHTRRCLSPRQWAMMVLAEVQGIQDASRGHEKASMSNRQEDVQNYASIT